MMSELAGMFLGLAAVLLGAELVSQRRRAGELPRPRPNELRKPGRLGRP